MDGSRTPFGRARWRALLIAGLTCAAVTPSAAQASPCAGADALPSERGVVATRATTLCLVNAERQGRGLARLRASDELRRAAQRHARDMVRRAYFDHVSPGGTDLLRRIEQAGDYLSGARTYALGENLAWGSGALASPRRIVASWMRSPGHRHNIVDPRFRELGVGIVAGAPRPGPVAAGSAATYVTEFGQRRG